MQKEDNDASSSQDKIHTSSQLSKSRIFKARLATFFGFFQIGILVFAWSTGTFQLRSQLGLDGESGDSIFGMIALAIGVGGAIGCFGFGKLIDKYGPRKIISICYLVSPLTLVALGFANAVTFAIAGAFMMGLLRGATDTAINMHGVEVERHYGKPIMASFHAAFPVGGFIGGLIGSALATKFVDSAVVSFSILGISMLILSFFVIDWVLKPEELLSKTADLNPQHTNASKASLKVITIMVAFGTVLLGSYLSEGAVVDWGQEFVRRVTETSAAAAALAVTFYSGASFIGRICADKLAELLGSKAVIIICSLLTLTGLIVLLTIPSLYLFYLGFALIGLGLSAIPPLMLSSAGRIDPANAGLNIGIVSGVGYVGLLAGPAFIALIVHNVSISWMPILPLALMLIVAICGPALMRFAPEFRRAAGSGKCPFHSKSKEKTIA